MRKAQSGYLLLGLDSRLGCGTLIRVRGELLGKTLDSVLEPGRQDGEAPEVLTSAQLASCHAREPCGGFRSR